MEEILEDSSVDMIHIPISCRVLYIPGGDRRISSNNDMLYVEGVTIENPKA